ncbi:YraN family protein [Candidatus Microgenomates bacterium]|nr:YraN family protein [Candidatus Microgenomates bacterium]
MSNILTGKRGEQLAYDHLRALGYRIIDTNVRTRFGEIDLIAELNEVIHFIEVKTRIGIGHGKPYEAVNYYKMRHMLHSAQAYVLQNSLTRHKLSMDVMSIVLHYDQSVQELKFFENITQ